MTELAYLSGAEAAYTRAFNARIVARPPGGVVLDRTFFYPTGGGQLADHGSLSVASGERTQVMDVTKSGNSVIHRLARNFPAAFAVGAEVSGELDWERRHRHMRLHTAQHLVSALVFTRTGLRTRQASMAGNGGVIELEAPWPADHGIPKMQDVVARSVGADLPVRVEHVPRARWQSSDAPRAGLVPLPAHVDPVRVIEIEGVDRCPCGGTHVRSTGEIGEVRLDEPVLSVAGRSRLAFTVGAPGPTTRPG